MARGDGLQESVFTLYIDNLRRQTGSSPEVSSGNDIFIHAGFTFSPNPEQFYFKRGPGYTLVHPRKNKQIWSPDERWLRSIIISDEGEVLSCGFPKFFNLGERQDDENALIDAAENNQVAYLEKFDGVLVIRSVIDGRVVWRTRGTLDGGLHAGAIDDVLSQQLTALQDPSLHADRSLLFELTHPDFPIIIPAERPALTMLAMVSHRDLQIGSWEDTVDVAAEVGASTPQLHRLPPQLDELRGHVSEWRDSEGIVARIPCPHDGQRLVKIKADHYLEAHAARFNFTPQKALQLCHLNAVADGAQYHEALASQGYDHELTQHTAWVAELWLERRMGFDQRLVELNDRYIRTRPASRRALAEQVQALEGWERSAVFALLDGKVEESEQIALRELQRQLREELRDSPEHSQDR